MRKIRYKTEEEINLIKKSCDLLAKTHAEVAKHIKPGIKTIVLDKIAEEFIRDNGGIPAFKGYADFPNTLCVSVNSVIVHGIPSDYELKDGDIVSIDSGVILNGWYSDSAYTYTVGEVADDVKELLRVTKEALYLGIEQAVKGNRIGDIGYAVQNHAEAHGFSVVREFVGHGVGQQLHEAPEVPNFGKRGRGVKINAGLVIAIEPMINMGKRNIVFSNDGWTVKAADDKPSAHYEHMVAVFSDRTEVLTSFDYIEDVLNKK